MMKTIDEVIANVDKWRENARNCDSCVCHPDSCPYQCDLVDALQYLKAYRDDKDELTAFRAFWKEQHENNALTWEQLKQMEGRPVWVELYGSDYDEWVLVHAWNDDVMWFTDCNGTIYTEKEHLLGKTWRAFRKERE